MGLISLNENIEWAPVTCHVVVSMLKTLSKYGESFLGYSKGRGFKIILEQAKVVQSCNGVNVDLQENASDSESKDKRCAGNCSRKRANNESNQERVRENIRSYEGRMGEIDESYERRAKSVHNKESVMNGELVQESLAYEVSLTETEFNMSHMEASSVGSTGGGLFMSDCQDKQRLEPRWICTVHVGWPIPFTVQAEGLSLPAAQMMGYLAVINKLKVRTWSFYQLSTSLFLTFLLSC